MIDIVLDANCLISYISLKNCSMNTLKGLGSDFRPELLTTCDA